MTRFHNYNAFLPAAILLASCLRVGDGESDCRNQILQDVPSPDGRRHAVVFARDCGATTDFSTQPPQMPMYARFPTILLVGALASCTIDRSHDLRADTYDVYAAALDSFPAARTTSPIISSRTWRYSLSRALGDTSDFYRSVQADSDVGGRLLSVFDSLNTTSAELCACFPNHARVTLVADTLRAGVAGPFVVSRVAFSPDQARALVAIGYSCGPLCGGQALYLVVRDRRGWRVARTLLSGVS